MVRIEETLNQLIEHFEQVFIDQDSLQSEVAQRVMSLLPDSKIQVIRGEPVAQRKGDLTAEQFDRSKKWLHIKPFKGQFFRRCPGATQKKALACCNYFVLNLGQQCNMNCSYCYLQSYLNTPVTVIYSNIDQALEELAEMAKDHGHLPVRVGTGEVIDSLSLDPLTLYSKKLISFFNQHPKWILEFKTKSDHVHQFLDVAHCGNTVVSWSVNAEAVINNEEHGTASLNQRLVAAELCRDHGYRIAFHIDPLIHHPGWQDGYRDLVKRITTQFKPKDLHVISLGALRFQPEQRHMMRERFGLKSWVTSAEMFSSDGGKLRYDQRLRNEMFQFVKNEFKSAGPGWNLFLCMETPESWISTFAGMPMAQEPLKDFFRPLPKLSHPLKTL